MSGCRGTPVALYVHHISTGCFFFFFFFFCCCPPVLLPDFLSLFSLFPSDASLPPGCAGGQQPTWAAAGAPPDGHDANQGICRWGGCLHTAPPAGLRWDKRGSRFPPEHQRGGGVELQRHRRGRSAGPVHPRHGQRCAFVRACRHAASVPRFSLVKANLIVFHLCLHVSLHPAVGVAVRRGQHQLLPAAHRQVPHPRGASIAVHSLSF